MKKKKWHEWRILAETPDDLPAPGERVNICVGEEFVGEGYRKEDGNWYRYCDFGPVDQYMSCGVTAWMPLPPGIGKRHADEGKP